MPTYAKRHKRRRPLWPAMKRAIFAKTGTRERLVHPAAYKPPKEIVRVEDLPPPEQPPESLVASYEKPLRPWWMLPGHPYWDDYRD